MLCNKTEATGSPELPKAEKSLSITEEKQKQNQKTHGKIYSTWKRQAACAERAREAKSEDHEKLPKPSTTHPPGLRQRHRQALVGNTGPAL